MVVKARKVLGEDSSQPNRNPLYLKKAFLTRGAPILPAKKLEN